MSGCSRCAWRSGHGVDDLGVLDRHVLDHRLYWFDVNVTVMGEGYRSRSKGKEGSCGHLMELGTAKATHLAGSLQPGVAGRPDRRATAGETVGWCGVADRAV